MSAEQLIDIIAKEHSRTSCADDNIDNGFYLDEEGNASDKYFPRCFRCALLEVTNGTVKRDDENVLNYFT